MTHEEETLSRWNDIGREETVYVRWAMFFRSMIGRPGHAAELCELGMRIVRGEARLGLGARRNVERLLRLKHMDGDRSDA